MITHKEQCEVYHARYGLSAAETAQIVKADNKLREFCGLTWRTKEQYEAWLDEMEELGSLRV